jgi:hypothetical protein
LAEAGVPIVRSGALAREFCRQVAHAEVAAVFERSIYLRSGDMFVCLGEPGIGNGPLTLIADFRVPPPQPSPASGGGGAPSLWRDLGLHPGQSASISDRCITIGNSARFTFDHCELWRPPRWPRSRSRLELTDVCGAIARLIAAEAPEEGLGRVYCLQDSVTGETALARIARPRIAGFESWLRDTLETDRIAIPAPSETIAGLIGLGPGLTPSGDDFLVGSLALLDALAERKAHAALAGAIADVPRGLTSPLSDCFLRAAAAGHVGEHLHYAVSAVISGAPSAAVAAIRKIGHSSGWDMLAGVASTLHVVAAARNAYCGPLLETS